MTSISQGTAHSEYPRYGARYRAVARLSWDNFSVKPTLKDINQWKQNMSDNLQKSIRHIAGQTSREAQEAAQAMASGDAHAASMWLVNLFTRAFSEGTIHAAHEVTQRLLLRQRVENMDVKIRNKPAIEGKTDGEKAREGVEGILKKDMPTQSKPETGPKTGMETKKGKTPAPAKQPTRRPTKQPTKQIARQMIRQPIR